MDGTNQTGDSGGLVVGVDAGGTATRCLVATVDGTVLARGLAGGANQNSSAGRPADALGAALRSALSHVDTSRIEIGVIGAAGSGGAGRAAARDAAQAAWRSVGLPGEVVPVTDLEVAFAAGTPHRSGFLLLAGTGAAAVAFGDGVLRRRCDGYGWLLGDVGSAVWIGLEGLRRVLEAIDGRAAPTALTGPITALAAGPEGFDDRETHAQALLAWAFARPPAALGQLAPLVNDAAAAGDAAALAIVSAASTGLLHALDTVAEGADGPVVLAGSVLLSPGPVAGRVRAGVRARFGVDAVAAHDGAAGAANMAIARLTGAPVSADVHMRLTSGHAGSAPPVEPAGQVTAWQ